MRDETAEVLKALGQSARLRVLELVAASEKLSPKDASAQLDMTFGNLSHHFQVLARTGRIELVETHQVRGTVAHVYAVTATGRAGLAAARTLDCDLHGA
jgi:DNA-binding transcriptional ArsR family regulator